MAQRQMHLVAYLKTGPTALHVGGWRHPESTLDDILHPSRYQHIARVLEAGCFDGCFFADLFGLYDIHGGSFDPYVRRGGQISFLDPTVVLPVMAAATTHLGLGATLSTSSHTPCHLARWLGSLDMLSGGRVAWNVVTSATDLEARNAGMDALPPREERSMKAEGLTLAEAAARRHRRRELVGTPAQIADRLQGLFEAGMCDGFVLSPTMFPGMFEQFCRAVVPELQRRGIFRKRYTGSTLRENLRG